MYAVRHATDIAAAITVDHRSGRSSVGAPVSGYRRVSRVAPSPNYAARRLAAVGVLFVGLLLAVQAFGAAAAVFGSRPVLAAGDDAGRVAVVATLDTHVARNGDSLWSIADTYRGDVSRSSFIDTLVELNGGTAVQVGQAVLLPRS